MGLAVTASDIVRFKGMADRKIARAERMKLRTEAAIATVVNTSEVSASAFLFGLAQGKFGGISLVGVPVDLLAGLGLHILGFAGIGGKNANHLHAFADGALASFFTGLGRQVGVTIQTPADKERIAQSAGMAGEIGGVTGGAALADEELARMVAAGRR